MWKLQPHASPGVEVEACDKDIGVEIFKTPKDHAERSYSFLSA